MGEQRRTGVDVAIAILKALAAANGEIGTTQLLAQTGLPRASLYRVAGTLADAGLVTLARGRIGVGPMARHLVGVHGAVVAHEDQLWTQRAPRRLKRAPTPEQARGPVVGTPVDLSRPFLSRRRGRFRIGFSNASTDNPWRVALVHSVEHAAAALGDRVERLSIRHANHDSAQQCADIAALVAEGADGLIVSAVEPRGIGEAVSAVMARGIPVVMVDRGVLPHVPHTSFVTTDDTMIGRTTALWMAETMRGKGALMMLPGHPEAEPAQRRLCAARQLLTEFPDIEILDICWTNWHRDTARELMAGAIARWGNRIGGVWCDSGQQGVGSLQAFVAAGARPGDIPPHTGGDQNLAYKLAIRNRVPLAAVDYPPVMGIKAVEVLYAVLRGNWVPKVVDMPSEVILTKGAATRSVRAHLWAEDHVRWDLPDDLILSTGLGPAYNPRSFRIHYPGNLYNRSAVKPLRARP